jgi:hypothetical protein
MRASQEVNEWIDGFLFVANKPILDLLKISGLSCQTGLRSCFRMFTRSKGG